MLLFARVLMHAAARISLEQFLQRIITHTQSVKLYFELWSPHPQSLPKDTFLLRPSECLKISYYTDVSLKIIILPYDSSLYNLAVDTATLINFFTKDYVSRFYNRPIHVNGLRNVKVTSVGRNRLRRFSNQGAL